MKWFKKKQKIDKKPVDKKELAKKFIIFVIVTFVSTAAYNLFFTPRKIVIGGIMGLAVIVQNVLGMNMSEFIWIASAVVLVLSFIFLDRELALKTIAITILVPVFSSMTENISSLIDISDAGTLIVVVFGGIINGITSGLVLKANFPIGGSGNLSQIMAKYMKMSVGNAGLLINGAIILVGGYFFGWTSAIYALIANYITGIATDKVLLGIGFNKAIYIVTTKDEEIKQYLLENLGIGVTVMSAHGGYAREENDVLLAVIPSKDYFLAKEGIEEIDPKSFFVVTDSYQVFGGNV